MTNEEYACNFCRRMGDIYCTSSFDRMVAHYYNTHDVPSGRVYAIFGKVRP